MKLWAVLYFLSSFGLCSTSCQALVCALLLVKLWAVLYFLSSFGLCSTSCQALGCALLLVKLWAVLYFLSSFGLCSTSCQALVCALLLVKLWSVLYFLSSFGLCSISCQALKMYDASSSSCRHKIQPRSQPRREGGNLLAPSVCINWKLSVVNKIHIYSNHKFCL